MGVQLGAMALSALRIPLAAQYPQPGEFQAVRVLLAAQFAASSLLFPSLLRTGSMMLIAVSASWVMLVLSAGLAGWEFTRVLPIGAYFSFWLIVLWMVAELVRGRCAGIAAAIVSVWVIGGALLGYLQLDFGAALSVEYDMRHGPIWLTCGSPEILPIQAWWGLVGIGIIGLFALAARHFFKKMLYLTEE